MAAELRHTLLPGEQGTKMEDLTARLNVIDERLHSLLERL
jgi:hypothetical protein